MLIGILSDSHGRVGSTRLAVAALRDAGAAMLLHLGDVGSEEVIDELAGHDARIVFGNCDYDADALASYARSVDVAVDHPMGRLEVGERRIAYTHGHVRGLVDAALCEGVDYLLFGHTHELHDERIGPTRLINPGALFRASRYTACLLDPGLDALRVIELERSPVRSPGGDA